MDAQSTPESETEAEVSGLGRDKRGVLLVLLQVAVLQVGRGHQDLGSTSETWLSPKWLSESPGGGAVWENRTLRITE